MEEIPKGGFLGLDWGQKKVGYATADELGIVVTSRGHFIRARGSATWTLSDTDVQKIKDLVELFESGGIIMGLPLGRHGVETEASEGARKIASEIELKLNLPVKLVDEILTTWESRGAEDDDSAAAKIIVEDYIRGLHFRNKGVKGLGLFGALVGLGLLAGLGLAGKIAYEFALKPAEVDNRKIIIDVPPQSNFTNVRNNLSSAGLSVNPWAVRIWTKLNPNLVSRLRVGEYEIQTSWSPMRILSEINLGQPLHYKFAIKEGHNIFDAGKEFELVSMKDKESFSELMHDENLIKRMQIPQRSSGSMKTLEGFLFPDTYTYQKYDTPRIMVESFLSEFEKRALPILMLHPWGKTPEGRYRLLTLASIVEKESGDFNEQPTIASVFWNRLNKRMRLQSDPTIIYGLLPNFNGNIVKAQILQPHPYNTYTIPELPIGPICNPGESALKAVVNPASTQFLYFVAKGNGQHIFSQTYESHKSHVQEFQIDPAKRARARRK